MQGLRIIYCYECNRNYVKNESTCTHIMKLEKESLSKGISEISDLFDKVSEEALVKMKKLTEKCNAQAELIRVLENQNTVMNNALEEIRTTCDVMDARNEAIDALRLKGELNDV